MSATARWLAVPGRAPISVLVSAVLWFVLGAIGAASGFIQLLGREIHALGLGAPGGMGPGPQLPPTASVLLAAVVGLALVFLAYLTSIGSRWARIALTTFVVLVPALLLMSGGEDYATRGFWPSVLDSPVLAVVAVSVVAAVLMWLPAANRYFQESRALRPAAWAVTRPWTVLALLWALLVAGVAAALQGFVGLALVLSDASPWAMSGTAPPLALVVLWAALMLIGIADIVLAEQLHGGRAWSRLPITLVPVAGLALLIAAPFSLSPSTVGGPGLSDGVVPVIISIVIAQGLAYVLGLAPAVLVWRPSARRYCMPASGLKWRDRHVRGAALRGFPGGRA